MQTTCPDCTSSFSVSQPGTDPGAFVGCDHCGGQVQGGAFLCPGCKAGLQVVRSLLPAEGGNGRCPECSEVVWVPPLGVSSSSPSESSNELSASDSSAALGAGDTGEEWQEDADEATPSESESQEASEPAPHVLGTEGTGEGTREDSFLAAGSTTAKKVATWPAEKPAKPSKSHRGLGFFLGLLVGAGTAVGLMVTETWSPTVVPWQGEFPFALEATWAAAAGLVGGILGLLLGGRRN